jgi:hypothetical protein
MRSVLIDGLADELGIHGEVLLPVGNCTFSGCIGGE